MLGINIRLLSVDIWLRCIIIILLVINLTVWVLIRRIILVVIWVLLVHLLAWWVRVYWLLIGWILITIRLLICWRILLIIIWIRGWRSNKVIVFLNKFHIKCLIIGGILINILYVEYWPIPIVSMTKFYQEMFSNISRILN